MNNILGFASCSIGRSMKVNSKENIKVAYKILPKNKRGERFKLEFHYNSKLKSCKFLDEKFYKKIMKFCGENGHHFVVGKTESSEPIKAKGSEFANLINRAWEIKICKQ